jgi:hypothetical protein
MHIEAVLKLDGAAMHVDFSRPLSGRPEYETQRLSILLGEGVARFAEPARRHNGGTKAASQSALTGFRAGINLDL